MRRFIVIGLFMVITSGLNAQKYTTAGGIRIGTEFGLTVQQHLWDKYTLEAIVQKGFFNDLTMVSALFEQHNKIISKGTNFYVGAGPQIGFYGDKGSNNKYETQKNAVGVSLVGGIETRINHIVLSFDYKPSINFVGGRVFDSQTALSVRYIFIKAHKKEQKWMFWKKWKGNTRDEDFEDD